MLESGFPLAELSLMLFIYIGGSYSYPVILELPISGFRFLWNLIFISNDHYALQEWRKMLFRVICEINISKAKEY